MSGVTQEEIFGLLNCKVVYSLREMPVPDNDDEIIRHLIAEGYLTDSLDGKYSITNMGALLLANDITKFPSIAHKRVRIVRYTGANKMSSDLEREGSLGYAQGFSGIIKFIMSSTPKTETYVNGVRRLIPHFPEVAIREIVANALIHQDFTINGAGPMVEIYNNRIEIVNPGHSLIELDRILDERRSRNVKLAASMRQLHLCEERGGGLDKAVISIKMQKLPAPAFYSSQDSMRVALFSPKAFSEMSKQDKERACFFHCVLRWIQNDYMNNTSLRQRFSLPDEDYQAVSALISSMIKSGRIKPADPKQGNRAAKYIPYWA
jgi:predicted HTH transcriptional regulator